jgi:hypothetical protein
MFKTITFSILMCGLLALSASDAFARSNGCSSGTGARSAGPSSRTTFGPTHATTYNSRNRATDQFLIPKALR